MKKRISLDSIVKTAISAAAVLPFVRPKKTSVLPMVLGGIGVAILGGVAALYLNPRARTRALGMAKDTATRVKGQIGQTDLGRRFGIQANGAQPNGIAKEHTGYSTGL